MNLKLRGDIQTVSGTRGKTKCVIVFVIIIEFNLTTNREMTFPPIIKKDIIQRYCGTKARSNANIGITNHCTL